MASSTALKQHARLPHVGERYQFENKWVEVYSHAILPTRFGKFNILVFRTNQDANEHVALVRGCVQDVLDVPVRLHSECLTGDVLGSLRCDCRDQLTAALKTLGGLDTGVLLYMRQEGRGIGLGNKIRAYALQEQGLDTFAANRHLGFDDDLRDYDSAALMLKSLQIHSIQLFTNNPRKIFGLKQAGISVSNRIPIIATTNAHNIDYLKSKAQAGHWLSSSQEQDLSHEGEGDSLFRNCL